LPALALLPGCAIFVPQWEGVWLLELPVNDNGQTTADLCEADCDESFSNADCPDEVEVDEIWEYTINNTLSAEAYFIEIFKGKSGDYFGVINNEIYLGIETASTKQLVLTWEGKTDSFDESEHIDDGYTFSTTEVSTTLETLTFNKAQGAITGTWETKVDSMIEYSESDEWDPQDVGFQGGQIPSNILEPDDVGDNQNTAEDSECDGDCEVMTSVSCKPTKQDFEAIYAGKYENGMYTGISKAKQEAGD
jgi:hypothetical protein